MIGDAPLVYCETNWLVAVVHPHHQHHAGAQALLAAADRGDCRVLLPAAACLEAPHPVREVSRHLARAVAQLRDDLGHAARNGEPALLPLASTLANAPALDRFLARDAAAELAGVLRRPGVHTLEDVPDMLRTMDTLRPRMSYGGKDIVDLYLLAAVIAHRRTTAPEVPAVLFSLNREEFEPRAGGALPPDFYDPDRLVWRGDFDLASALAMWRARFGGA